MALIRKRLAGSSSHGHVWDEDGAVVEINDPEEIAALLAIPDGGFSEVIPPAKPETVEPDTSEPETEDPDSDSGDEVSEVDHAEDTATAAPAKKTASRKPAARKPQE